MSFEMQDKTDIQNRIVSSIKKITDKTSVEGSFSRDVIDANSTELEIAYAEMAMMMEACYADTAWGEYLTMRAKEYGVERKAATYSIVMLTITGAANAFIIKGSLFATKDNVKFYTNEDVTIGSTGTATVKATCGTSGAIGNVKSGIITEIPMSIVGVREVTNLLDAYDGFEEETDKELLERYLTVVRTPATSGNKYHYYNWAMGIDGVGSCRVLPLWDGAGTVKVIIVNSEMATASADLIKKVSDYIESVRPIGATVTVASPSPLKINIKITGIVGTADVTAFKTAVNTLFKDKNIELTSVSPAQIGGLLLQQSTVTDYETITLNDSASKIVIGDDQIAAVGDITIG